MIKLQRLMTEVSYWTSKQFNQTSHTIISKLFEEVAELKQAHENGHFIDEAEELVDIFHLTLDYAHKLGISAEYLIELTNRKLVVNKKRDWKIVNGIYKHREIENEFKK